jgi:hypothetical protein
MLSELMQRVQDVFKPYTFEDYVRDANPQNSFELEQLERNWFRYKNEFNSCY